MTDILTVSKNMRLENASFIPGEGKINIHSDSGDTVVVMVQSSNGDVFGFDVKKQDLIDAIDRIR